MARPIKKAPAPPVAVEPFKYTAKQIEALLLLTDAHLMYVLLFGGSRSGKTFLLVRCLFLRAFKAPGSNHLIVRRHMAHARMSIWRGTIKQVIRKCYPNIEFHFDNKDHILTFPNGSCIYVTGTDDEERVEKILGNEYSTILAEEVSQIPYDTITTLQTRLAENKGLVNKFWFSCNPPHKTHWTYKLFILLTDPDSKNALTDPTLYGHLLMNPKDNEQNLAVQYMKILDNLPERKKARFRDGLFLDVIEGAIWEEYWIADNRSDCKTVEEIKEIGDVLKIAIGVDPAIKAKSDTDQTGIVATAQVFLYASKKVEYFVLRDATAPCTYKPLQWATVVKNLYEELEADYVVVETNQGGDMVASTLRSAGYTGRIIEVHAYNGKHVRADPIAAIYEQGRVHHLKDPRLNELEECLINYIPLLTEKSPDRLDALVLSMASYEDNTDRSQLVSETDYAGAMKLINRR